MAAVVVGLVLSRWVIASCGETYMISSIDLSARGANQMLTFKQAAALLTQTRVTSRFTASTIHACPNLLLMMDNDTGGKTLAKPRFSCIIAVIYATAIVQNMEVTCKRPGASHVAFCLFPVLVFQHNNRHLSLVVSGMMYHVLIRAGVVMLSVNPSFTSNQLWEFRVDTGNSKPSMM